MHFSGPAVTGDTAYFRSGDIIYALDIRDGTLKWMKKIGNLVDSPIIATDNLIYVGGLYVLDATTGKVRWHHNTGEDMIVRLSFADGILYYVAKDRYLYALIACSPLAAVCLNRNLWLVAITFLVMVVLVVKGRKQKPKGETDAKP